MTINRKTQQKKDNNSTKCYKKTRAFLVFFLLLFCNAFLLSSCQNINNVDIYSKLGRIDDNETSVMDPQLFAVSINSKAYVDKDRKALVYIKNDKSNLYKMKVNITEDNTGEVIYQSGIIKPGKQINSIEINKNLEVGKHNSTVVFLAIDSETKKVKGQVVVSIVLVVE